jgi:hypothetical protein
VNRSWLVRVAHPAHYPPLNGTRCQLQPPDLGSYNCARTKWHPQQATPLMQPGRSPARGRTLTPAAPPDRPPCFRPAMRSRRVLCRAGAMPNTIPISVNMHVFSFAGSFRVDGNAATAPADHRAHSNPVTFPSQAWQPVETVIVLTRNAVRNHGRVGAKVSGCACRLFWT